MTRQPDGRVSFGAKEWIALLAPTLMLIIGAIHLNSRLSVVETTLSEQTTAIRRYDDQREGVARNEQRLSDIERRINTRKYLKED